ncbi:MAG: aminotransferase class I/II-fold pyridoxal phosphate-dependent enzyme, partial [Gammaproteobacteria bacterium]
SFSKTLAPGYRVGWVLPGRYHDQILEWKQATSSATASIPQLGVAEFLRSGDYDRHLVRLRKAYREQVDRMRFMIMRHFPEGTRVSSPQGGFVLWVELPRGSDCLEIFNEAVEHKIGVTPGILFSATRKFKNFIRLNCGFPWTESLEEAVAELGRIIQEQLERQTRA